MLSGTDAVMRALTTGAALGAAPDQTQPGVGEGPAPLRRATSAKAREALSCHIRARLSDPVASARSLLKNQLAQEDWPDMNAYAEAKGLLISEITARAEKWATRSGWTV